jgi:hypothetical protein
MLIDNQTILGADLGKALEDDVYVGDDIGHIPGE